MRSIFKRVPFLLPCLILIFLIITFDFFEISIPFHGSKLKRFKGEEVTAIGVVEECNPLDEGFSLIVRVKAFSLMKNKVSELTMIYGKDKSEIGSLLKIKGILELPEENTNDGLFNYRKYLKSRDIFTIIKKAKYEKIGYNPNLGHILKEGFREKVEEVFYRYTEKDTASMLCTVFLADYEYIDDELREDFQKYGIIHLLSVSGLHIAIITTLLIYILALFRVRRKIAAPVFLSLIFLYAYLLDFKAPILRAFIMSFIMQLSLLLKEPDTPLNDLCLAAILILIFRPYDLFTGGFMLSFLAMLSLIVILPNLKFIKENKLLSAFFVILSCQIGTLPVILYNYNYFNILVFFANFIITPIFTLILWGGMLLFPISLIPYFGIVMGKILDFSVLFIKYSMSFLNSLPTFSRNIKTPNLFEILLYIFIIWFVIKGRFLFPEISVSLNFREEERIKKSLSGMFLSVILSLIILQSYMLFTQDNFLKISMLDVGQGDSFLIQTPKYNILCDTGGDFFKGDKIPERITVPYLQKQGINKIDALILSHYDADHSAGVPLLLKNFKVQSFILPYKSKSDIYRIIEQSGIKMIFPKPGDKWFLDRENVLKIVYSEKPLEEGNNSVVFSISHRDNGILFTGDMEYEEELRAMDYIENYAVLKIAHHGSKTSTREEFLNKVSPALALISVGKNNLYGHPDSEVIERLKDNNIGILRTDERGEIILNFKDEGIYFSDFYQRKAQNKKIIIFQGFICIIGGIMMIMMELFFEKNI